jgi:orotate phosphoribosyltransferase
MKPYQENFTRRLASTGALFFKSGLDLKDGRGTPYFVNIGKFNDGDSSYELGCLYAGIVVDNLINKGKKVDIISGPSYKASAIAQATAIALHKEHNIKVGFNYDRKEAKTHGEATQTADMWVGAEFFDGCNWVIVDDVGTTMNTKVEHIDKAKFTEQQKKIKTNLIGIVLGVDREQVDAVYNTPNNKPTYLPNKKVDPSCVLHGKRGEDAILKFMREQKVPVFAGVGITAAVEFTHSAQLKNPKDARVVDDEAMAKFREYMRTEEPGYGADLTARQATIDALLA